MDTLQTAKLFVFFLLCAFLFLVSCGDDGSDDGKNPSDDDSTDDDDDDDDDDSVDDDDDDDNNDDAFPSIALIKPLVWKRYACSGDQKDGIALVTGNFNLHQGKEGTPDQVAQALAEYGPFDVFALQECPEEYAGPIAEALDMDYFYTNDRSLMSKTPLIDPQDIPYVDTGWGHFQHAQVEIEGVTFSVYGMHVDWDQMGDVQNRELVDDYLALDPVERILLMGDWNEELGSTQEVILEEYLADAWSSMGVTPSTRTTWPAIMFYGAEGQQLIDNTFFNKASGACATEGQIIHLTPNRSDHKPQVSTVFFPAVPAFAPPTLQDVVYGLGDNTVGLLFDKPLAHADVLLYDGDQVLDIADQYAVGDGALWLVETASPLPAGRELSATVLTAEDIDGALLPEPVDLTFPMYENLIANPGAEDGDAAWDFHGVQATDEFHHVTPLTGEAYFTGVQGKPRAFAAQEIDLSDYAEMIDAGYGWLAFGGASRTGYRLVEDGTSNLLLPHDESEGMVELLDADGRLLRHVSGGRYDTLYWQPWRVTEPIPPGARKARVILRFMAAEDPIFFNSASFDALHLSVMTGENPHHLAGGNLVDNSLFLSGMDDWQTDPGIIRAKDHWIPIRSNIDINSATGDYWVAALLTSPGEKKITQTLSLADFAVEISEGTLSLEWGAWLRTWNPRSTITLGLSFLNQAGSVITSDVLDPVNIPEWFVYSAVSAIPAGAVSAELSWTASTDQFLIGVGAFFDAPFVYPVSDAIKK